MEREDRYPTCPVCKNMTLDRVVYEVRVGDVFLNHECKNCHVKYAIRKNNEGNYVTTTKNKFGRC